MTTTLSSIAAKDIGQGESPRGSNKGPQIEKFLRATTLDGDGWPWCAAAVSYWVQQWIAANGVKLNAPRIAAVSEFPDWAHANGLHVCQQPAPNCIVVFTFSHIGIVEAVLPNGSLSTIEGNTNNDGGREGYEVERKTRPQSLCKLFIQLPTATGAAPVV
jgi:hypothetical protein